MKKKTIKWFAAVSICLAIVIVYIVLDYINFCGMVQFDVLRINVDFLTIFFNSFVMLIIAIFTFLYIDNKQIERQTNRDKTARRVLKKVYERCEQNVVVFDDQNLIDQLGPVSRFSTN